MWEPINTSKSGPKWDEIMWKSALVSWNLQTDSTILPFPLAILMTVSQWSLCKSPMTMVSGI
jgi:hypothetical protein